VADPPRPPKGGTTAWWAKKVEDRDLTIAQLRAHVAALEARKKERR
jgi:hypothetical protein